jgi:hypothetical protein
MWKETRHEFTDSLQQSPSWEVCSHLGGQEISFLLQQKAHLMSLNLQFPSFDIQLQSYQVDNLVKSPQFGVQIHYKPKEH